MKNEKYHGVFILYQTTISILLKMFNFTPKMDLKICSEHYFATIIYVYVDVVGIKCNRTFYLHLMKIKKNERKNKKVARPGCELDHLSM